MSFVGRLEHDSGLAKITRMAWTAATLLVVQGIVCGVALLPAVAILSFILRIAGSSRVVQVILVSLALMPAYVLFALCLMMVSPLTLRLLGWRTPPDASMRLADIGWPLLSWVRYGASIHLVRLVAGTLFRGTPIWTLHLRLAGARLGRRVYVNSLSVSDYNLLECGDDVVIGGSAHVAGHTVERGVVKTARVRLGDRVTIGIGSVIEIGADIGPSAQIGAMSFVPKYAHLPGGVVYVGVPAEPIKKA
jgi:acetyltransferase-like isoleucine patch superfamily enzyme